ncbi:MAG: flagellar biosynthesis protein FlhF [Deltaproteobacteria bacterium]|nr:flagellar biosynthesis protein FlhF [Deltaproteobacteria bacterium]
MNALAQTFRAPTSRAALAKVRAALGGEAIILATREVRPALLADPEVEITAAPPEPAPAATRSVVVPRPRGDALEELFRDETRPRAGAATQRLPDGLVDELVEGGVAPVIARALVRDAEAAAGPNRHHLLREEACHAMLRRLPTGPAPWLEPGRQVFGLVGPTGTGKTTTLAKMAARARMAGRSVAFITTDTFRVGALDVLARYGDILGVRCGTARNREELARALQAAAAHSLVLVDTAGRTETAALARQAEMLLGHSELRLFLAHSVVAGHRDMGVAGQRYALMRPSGLLFTKLDEAAAPGGVFSTDLGPHCPFVGLTDGQNIPEDLHPADGLRLVERILP